MAFVEDTDLFFADLGIQVTWGSYSTKALLDMPGKVVQDGQAITTGYQITFKSAALPGLSYGNAITVGSVAYTVDEVMPLDDGVMSVAALTKD